jgi:thioredoxin reductase
MVMSKVGVVVVGGGPAGLSAAIAASFDGASVLLVEREAQLGGTLKQSIHAGFGVIRYDELLTGPEYAFNDIFTLEQTNTYVLLQTTVTRIVSVDNTFQLTLSNRHGIIIVEARSVILATGCIERSVRQIAIHGSRPALLLTAGAAQYYSNIMGQLPAKKFLIYGTGNIGLVMARRLTLEGGTILGVYESEQTPRGFPHFVNECITDFHIPLHFGHAITHVSGTQRVKSALITRVDKNILPIRGTELNVKCDSVIVSAGLIPENDLADSLDVPISEDTFGPICDQNNMTLVDGVFTCGNATHINDLVDYISESGEIAGRGAARYVMRDRLLVGIRPSKDFLYSIPQCLDLDMLSDETTVQFRVRERRKNVVITMYVDNHQVHSQEFLTLKPTQIERIVVNFSTDLSPDSMVELKMESIE